MKQLQNFNRKCQEVGFEDSFNQEAEGQQLAQISIYDVLHSPEKLTAYYLLNEVENMLGQRVVDVV